MANKSPARCEIRVFGPTAICKDGYEIKLTSNMRKMLCLIVAGGSDGLSIDRALTEAADGDASARANSRVRMDVSRLRKRIGADLLPNSSGVWRLQVDPAQVDYFALQSVSEAQLPDSTTINSLLRGRAFADASPGPFVNDAIRDAQSMRFALLKRMLLEPPSISVATLQSARRMIDEDPLNAELIAVVLDHHLLLDHCQEAREILANATINFHEMVGLALPPAIAAIGDRLGGSHINLPGSGIPDSQQQASATSDVLVGRETETQQVKEWLDGGRSEPLVITGASGSGKTTLLNALIRAAEERDIRVVHAIGREFESRKYLPFDHALGQVMQLVDDAADTVETEIWASVLDELAPNSAAGTIVIVDDCQWLDSPSANLLRYLMSGANPAIAVAMAGRSIDQTSWSAIEKAAHGRAAQVITLDNLTLEEIELLVARHAPALGVVRKRKLAEEVLTASDGLPAVAVRLIERTEGETHQIPDVVGSHGLEWFVASLSHATQRVALAAAVLGSHTSYPDLARLTELPDRELLDHLENLAKHGALFADTTPGMMGFPHALVRQAFLEAADPEEARKLQRSAAEIVASPHRRAQLLEASMEHVDPQLVAEAARRSADLHLHDGAIIEAVRAYGVADRLDAAGSSAAMLARWAGATERCGLEGSEIRIRAFNQAMIDGSLEAAFEAAVSGLPEAERPSGDPDRIALLEEIDATLLKERSRFIHAAMLSRQYALAGRSEEALAANSQAAALAESDRDRDAVARAKWLASYSSTSPTVRLFDAGFYPFDRLPDTARLLVAVDRFALGDVDQADEIRSEIADVLDPASDPTSYWHGLLFKSTIAAARGDVAQARIFADDAFEFGNLYGFREVGSAWLAQKFTLQWMYEEKGAASFFENISELGNIDVEEPFMARTTLAIAMHQSGHVEEASALAEELVSDAVSHRSYIGVGTIVMCARILGTHATRRAEMINILRPLSGTLIVLGTGFAGLGPADLALAHLSDGQERTAYLDKAQTFATENHLSGWTQMIERERTLLSSSAATGN